MLFCNKCGEKSADSDAYACGCAKALGGQRVPVTQFDISEQVKAEVVEHLSGATLLSDKIEDMHIVDEMLAQVNFTSNVAKLPDDDLTGALLQILRDSVNETEKVPSGSVDNFVSRPWGLSATNMTSQKYFNECFANEAKEMENYNPKSKCIDLLLGKHFRDLNPDAKLQEYKGIQLFGKNFAPVYVQPDALWTHNDQQYVVEFKTVKNPHSMIKYRKLEDWLHQVACSQLSSYDEVAAFNTSDVPVTADAKKYLVVVILPNEHGSRVFVLEVAHANVEKSSKIWFEWFDGREKPANDVKELNKYYTKQVVFSKIKPVAKEAKEREARLLQEAQEKALREQEEAEGWTRQKNPAKVVKKVVKVQTH